MTDRAPKLNATLTFHEGALEDLIEAQVTSSGYMLEGLTWADGVATAAVRPMTLEEREEAGVSTESPAEVIASQVRTAIIATHAAHGDTVQELRDELNDQYRMLSAKLEGLSATMQTMRSTSVVQEAPAEPVLRPDSPPVNGMSLAEAGQASFDTSDMTKRQIKDRKAYEARLAEIRQEQGHGNRHPQMPDANKHMRGKHEFDNFHEALDAALAEEENA
jgi:hypothetical protein